MGIDDDSKSGLGKLFLPHARILYSADISLCWTGPDQALPPSKYKKDVNVLIDYMLTKENNIVWSQSSCDHAKCDSITESR